VRSAVAKVENLALAPLSLLNNAIATVRSLGNLTAQLNDFCSQLNAEVSGIQRGATGLAGTLSLARVSEQGRAGSQAVFDALAKMLDVLQQTRGQRVGVHPGQSLAQVAAAHLGDATRWPEIAAANSISGQFVPSGTYVVQVPPKTGAS
jgi:nucleoid-associated protein YgaU